MKLQDIKQLNEGVDRQKISDFVYHLIDMWFHEADSDILNDLEADCEKIAVKYEQDEDFREGFNEFMNEYNVEEDEQVGKEVLLWLEQMKLFRHDLEEVDYNHRDNLGDH